MRAAQGLPIDHGGPTGRPFEPFPPEAVERSIVDRFLFMAERHAGRLAVQDAEQSLTYAELAERAGRIASSLQVAVEGRPGPIATLLPNDARLPAALLGALGAGRAFIPLDIDHPPERNRLIARQAGASVILTIGAMAAELRVLLGETTPVLDLETALASAAARPMMRPGPDDLAYILYTSGSTGAPKGVCHSHRNGLFDVLVVVDNVHLTPDDRLSLFYASVIGAIRRTLSALLSGASLHIMPPRGRGAAELAAEFRARRITYMHEVPTVFRRVAGALGPGERFDDLRAVRLSGDRSSWSDYELFRQVCPPDAVFGVNLGCTEVPSTYLHWFVDATVREPGGRLPVGREMLGVTVEVVDSDGRPAPEGETGEFRVSSPTMAVGYWNAPELTAEAFRPHPDDPQIRTYLTGDMGFRRPDGLHEFVGRKDHMVKLRGHRVEPAELEGALCACQGVVDAAAVIRRDGEGVASAMVAYVELEPGAETLLPRHLMALISRVLPKHLMPAVIFIVPKLPRLMNFKIDRPALERLDGARGSQDGGRDPGKLLDKVACAFEAVVPGRRATPEDNLLSLGGDSLQAVQLGLELQQRFSIEVPREVIRQSQSIRELATWISRRRKALNQASSD